MKRVRDEPDNGQSQKTRLVTLDILPPDIVQLIMRFLPFVELLRASSVCVDWKSKVAALRQEDKFRKERYYFDFGEIFQSEEDDIGGRFLQRSRTEVTFLVNKKFDTLHMGPHLDSGSDWPTMVLNTALFSGRYYYEVEILKIPAESHAQIGWISINFVPDIALGRGVGDDEMSWGLDTKRFTIWNGHTHLPHKMAFVVGDVLGCSIDIENGILEFVKNGDNATKCSLPFTNDCEPYFPGFSFNSMELNVIVDDFKYPRDGYRSIISPTPSTPSPIKSPLLSPQPYTPIKVLSLTEADYNGEVIEQEGPIETKFRLVERLVGSLMKAYSDLRFNKEMSPEDKLKRSKWLLFQTGVNVDYEKTPVEQVRKMALNAAEESVFEFHLEALGQFLAEYQGTTKPVSELISQGLSAIQPLTLKEMFALRAARLFIIVTKLDHRAQDHLLNSTTMLGFAPASLIDFSSHAFNAMCDILYEKWKYHEKNVLRTKFITNLAEFQKKITTKTKTDNSSSNSSTAATTKTTATTTAMTTATTITTNSTVTAVASSPAKPSEPTPTPTAMTTATTTATTTETTTSAILQDLTPEEEAELKLGLSSTRSELIEKCFDGIFKSFPAKETILFFAPHISEYQHMMEHENENNNNNNNNKSGSNEEVAMALRKFKEVAFKTVVSVFNELEQKTPSPSFKSGLFPFGNKNQNKANNDNSNDKNNDKNNDNNNDNNEDKVNDENEMNGTGEEPEDEYMEMKMKLMGHYLRFYADESEEEELEEQQQQAQEEGARKSQKEPRTPLSQSQQIRQERQERLRQSQPQSQPQQPQQPQPLSQSQPQQQPQSQQPQQSQPQQQQQPQSQPPVTDGTQDDDMIMESAKGLTSLHIIRRNLSILKNERATREQTYKAVWTTVLCFPKFDFSISPNADMTLLKKQATMVCEKIIEDAQKKMDEVSALYSLQELEHALAISITGDKKAKDLQYKQRVHAVKTTSRELYFPFPLVYSDHLAPEDEVGEFLNSKELVITTLMFFIVEYWEILKEFIKKKKGNSSDNEKTNNNNNDNPDANSSNSSNNDDKQDYCQQQ